MEVATFVLMGMRYEKDVLERLYQGVPDMEESSGYQLILEAARRRASGKPDSDLATARGGRSSACRTPRPSHRSNN